MSSIERPSIDRQAQLNALHLYGMATASGLFNAGV